MKRILSLVLILILSVGMLVACQLPDFPFFGTTTTTTTTQPTTPPSQYNVEAARDYISSMYVGWLDNNNTATNYTVMSKMKFSGTTYTITWATNNELIVVTPDEAGIEATISVPSMGATAIEYTLTGTITAPDGTTAELSYALQVPALKLNSHEDYMNAKEGDVLQVAGIVVAINSKTAGNKYNHVFLADLNTTGGYYCYSITSDPADLGIEVGMTVMVSGPMTPYSGMQEIKGGEVIILDKTIKTFEPVDITEAFTAGSNLGAYVGLPVVIKGVELAEQDLLKDTSQYLYFAIGEQRGYVRTYASDFPAGMITANDKAAIDADHAAHFGYKADVTGILILYSGAPYLIPMSVTPFTNYEEQTKTPAQKVESEKDIIKVETSFTADAVVDLPLVGVNYDDVVISWACDSEHVVIADGKLTITVPDSKVVITLTATFTCGEATDTKEFEITLNKKSLTAGEAIEIGAANEHNVYTEGKFLIAGIITEIYNETYGNMKITDSFGNVLTVYGTYSADGTLRFDAMETKPAVGDYVVLLGVLGQYNGTPQTKNAWIQSWTTPTSIPGANEIGTNNPNYTNDKYIVTGTVSEIANATYGNIYIVDAEGNKLYLYGLYDELGNRYDAMTNAPKVGDVITVLTSLGAYKDAPQGKNATLVALTPSADEVPHEHEFVEGKCECGETDPNYVAPEQPKEEVAYIFGMAQGNLNNTIYYLAGGMNGYYMETTTDASAALHVYLEETEGGYYFYCYVNGVKTYINMVVSGTHVNGAYESTPSTVHTLDSEKNTLIALVNGTEYWYGTRNDKTYTTMGPCAVSYAGFYGVLYPVEGGNEGGETPEPPAHEHEFVNGECACGEKDPNYVPPSQGGDDTTEGYTKVTSADQFTSGTYVIVVSTGQGLGKVDGTWITSTEGEIETFLTWTLEVNGSSVTIKDSNGVYVGPKGGNSNGIKTGTAYNWNWTFNADGTITFTGTGSDTVTLAFNSDGQYYKFRGYKNTTVAGQPDVYPSTFTVYKLAE